MSTFTHCRWIALALMAGCLESTYNEPNACSDMVSCTDPERSFCYLGNCIAPPDAGLEASVVGDANGDGTVGDAAIDAAADAPGSCSQSGDCSGRLPICAMSQCRACANSTECVGFDLGHGVCAPTGAMSGACVECATAEDCKSARKGCDVDTGSCVACVHNEDCATGLCSSGQCAEESTQVYVDATPAKCLGGDGSYGKPFCTVTLGLAKAMIPASPHTVIVRAGSYGENVLVTPGATTQVTILGVGKPTLSAPTGMTPALTVQTNGLNTDITVDGFVIVGSTGHAILCAGVGGMNSKTKLTIVRSTVQGAAQNGINSSNCTLTLDRDVIQSNAGGGVYLSASDFTLTNLLITSNGNITNSSFGGISIPQQATTSLIFHLTIVNNSARNNAIAGITSADALTATNTVLFGNMGMAEHDSNLTPSNCAYVGANSGSSVDLSGCQGQVFKSSSDFHLLTGMGTCVLVNKGHTPTSPPAALSFDLDGSPRPVGAYDIGAYEAP